MDERRVMSTWPAPAEGWRRRCQLGAILNLPCASREWYFDPTLHKNVRDDHRDWEGSRNSCVEIWQGKYSSA